MLADKLDRQFPNSWKDALKRLGIAAMAVPFVGLVYVILLFLAAVVGWLLRIAVESAR